MCIAYHEKKLGQLFCDFSSKEIVEMLQKECDAAGVEIRVNCRVNAVRKIRAESGMRALAVEDESLRGIGNAIPWWWRRADSRFRKLERRILDIKSRNNSATHSRPPDQGWFPCSLAPTIARRLAI